MSKIAIETVAVTEASIISHINKIEALLEGRLDMDNLHAVTGSATSLGKSSVVDIADYASPIFADKFFAKNDSDMALDPASAVDFFDDVFTPLLAHSRLAERFVELSRKATLTLNYENQVNLEKPSVVLSDSGLSREAQILAIRQAKQQYDREVWAYVQQDDGVPSFWEALGRMVTGSFYGGFIGAGIGGIVGGGPIGAFVGGIIGSFSGAFVAGTTLLAPDLNLERFPEQSDYDPFRENIQLAVFRHPVNYRPVSFLELFRIIEEETGAEIMDPVLNIDPENPPRQFGFAKQVSFTTDNNVATDTKRLKVWTSDPMFVDAETTVVAVGVAAEQPGEDIVDSKDDFVTILCEVSLLFREIA